VRKSFVTFGLAAITLTVWSVSGTRAAVEDLSGWAREFRQAVVSGKGANLERFFAPGACEKEIPGWKYNIKNGFLDFSGTEVLPLSDRAVLLHIPSGRLPYSGENEDAYFDFIYRIYEVEQVGSGFRIVRRGEDAFLPDFIEARSRIEVRPREQRLLIESTVTADLNNGQLIFKLAKEFEIEDFQIDGQKAPFKRLGYFIQAPWDRGRRVVISVKGNLPAPRDNNQFFSLDPNGFILRLGGFAAIPSPPPRADGSVFFSKDQTRFEMTYVLPKDFPHIQYGRVLEERIAGDQKIVTASLDGEWMDNLAIYAQKNWTVNTIQAGPARLVFYFPDKDRSLQEDMAREIRKMCDWCYSIFRAYPKSENFVVLDRFVPNAAINDSYSIITQDALTQMDDTYIHEMLHTVPQPTMKADALWRKEGFTNFLSFNFIDFRSAAPKFWKEQQRRFLHAFDQFSEPLAALTSTRMPTYWAAYQKGPWVYRMLSAVIGEPAFRKAMLEFGTMKDRVLDGARDYFEIFERISGRDLAWFESQWLDWKENPVLRIERFDESSSRGNQVRLKITQEGKVFRLPLEVEVKSQDKTIHKTFWLDSAAQEFFIPLASPPLSVRFDPEAKLFALLKTGKMSFLQPHEIGLPDTATVYRFQSNQSGKIIEYRINPGGKKFTLVKKEEGKESVLELSPDLSPLQFRAGGDSFYTIDPAAGKIHFTDDAYDIAEPVYPEEFIGLLFSCVDWTKSSAQSLLFLRSGQKRCAGAYAERETLAGRDAKLKINISTGTLEMVIRDGVPEEFTFDGKEKFIRMTYQGPPAPAKRDR